MTNTQPGTPAQPPAAPAAPAAPNAASAENLADQLDAVNRATEEAARRADARAAADAAEGRTPMGVVRDAGGRIVVTGRDGRQIVIDPKVVTDEDQVQQMVQTALEPPRPPAPQRGPSGGDVAIVSIIFPSLIVIMLIVWRIVATSKRPGMAAAAAGAPAELSARLARIEQAIEAVAIEVERISESERYSARLLTERLPEAAPANGQGAVRPLPAPTLDAPR